MKICFDPRPVLGFGLLAMATAGLAASPGAALLAGTDWPLHSIQSMDDAQGTTKIADPSRFTVYFGAEGRASGTGQGAPGQGGTFCAGQIVDRDPRARCSLPFPRP